MSRVRVMTWNVENLFLPFEEGGPDTQAAFDRKLASLVGVIDQEHPDVLGLQEIGSPEALAALQGALSHAMPHAAVGDPDSRGIRVAVLSVTPLSSMRKVRVLPDGLRRVQHRDLVFDDLRPRLTRP
jgi:exonuclease III